MSSAYNYLDDADRAHMQSDLCRDFDAEYIDVCIEQLKGVGNGPVRILDFGCADGYLTLSRFGGYENICVTGIDTDATCIGIANANNPHPNFSFRCMDITKADDFDKYELIFSANTLQHIRDPYEVIKRLWEKLVVGGTLMLRVPDDGFKTWQPGSKVLDLLIGKYPVYSPSDRFIGRKIFAYLDKLNPAPKKVNVFFKTECTVNMELRERSVLFYDLFDFRVRVLKSSKMWTEADECEYEIFKQTFVSDPAFFFLNIQPLILAYK